MFIKMLEETIDLASELIPASDVTKEQLDNIKIVAHRGWHSGEIKENTLEAFDKCVENNLFAIEFDVRWTKDLVPVVHHDASAYRVFDIDVKIKSLDFSTIRELIPEIPTLEEVINKYKEKIHMFIELKDESYADIDKQKITLANILSSLKPKDDFHFLSLSEYQFDLFDNFNSDCKVFVSETNINEISPQALAKNYAGITGHYLLTTDHIVSLHRSKNQKVGTGFLKNKTPLFRELNREIDWIFTDQPWQVLSIIKSM
jgi:glycerophosphoryl diester phosphodiesterase